jgi:hypothetical protein
MNDTTAPAAARVSAAAQLLDRGHGKSAQQSNVSVTSNIDLDKLSDAELMAMIESQRSNDPETEKSPSQLN